MSGTYRKIVKFEFTQHAYHEWRYKLYYFSWILSAGYIL